MGQNTHTHRYWGMGTLLVTVCIVFGVASHAYGQQLTPEERARLESELAQLEADIAQKRESLKTTQASRTTLERDIMVLDTQIEKAKLSLKQRQLTIKKLEGDIAEKELSIAELDAKQARQAAGLAELLRRIQEMDDRSIVELALGGTLSEVFTEMDQFESVQTSLSTSFEHIASTREDISAHKQVLESRQSEEEEMRRLQDLEKRAVESQEREKQQILSKTKGQEKEYQKIIAEREKSAAEVRNALFGLRDSGAIPFGTAYQHAKEASALTGVRPAVILGILAEESNLGENVGTGSWKVDMHPTRDRPVFEEICSKLGLNPDDMKVSKKPWYGWGGAMGPAQFIPSTWVQYEDRIAKVTGQNPPNPWTARTAIFATALLMADNGADRGTRAAERLAALRYLAGWGNANKPAYAFYGDDVMRLADKFQAQIDILER